ncbi:hypothetical protein C8Q76DRAFT_757244 [Earliella scabrosa]|nr:hypothetical protein C8Q76DRAFT_757244 [Earliella scabrosa]
MTRTRAATRAEGSKGKGPAVQHPVDDPESDKMRIHVYTDHYPKLMWNSTFRATATMKEVKERMLTQFLGEKYARDDRLALYHLPGGVACDFENVESSFRDRLLLWLEDGSHASVVKLQNASTVSLLPTTEQNYQPDNYAYLVIAPDSDSAQELPSLLLNENANDPDDHSNEAKDVLGPLPASSPAKLGQHIVNYRRFTYSPSEAAKIGFCLKRQKGEQFNYDGRFHHKNGRDTRGVPVEILWPSFALFKYRAEDASINPGDALSDLTYRFMHKSSALYSTEKERLEALRGFLSELLQIPIESVTVKNSTPDGSASFEIPLQSATEDSGFSHVLARVVAVEMKNEPGAGQCDAAAQALKGLETFCEQDELAEVVARYCCPTIAMALDGPMIRFYACVLTDRWICQPLLERAVFAYIPSLLHDREILATARVFHALRETIEDIKIRTRRLFQGPISDLDPFRPSMFPAPTSFTLDSKVFTLEYQGGQIMSSKLIYPARIAPPLPGSELDGLKVIVKFTQRYGLAAHQTLANHGLAPKLLYCGKLYNDIPFDGLQMVVFEDIITEDGGSVYTDRWRKSVKASTSSKVRAKVRHAIIELLHKKGLVHGNVRWDSIWYTESDSEDDTPDVKFLHFDWAGEEGEARFTTQLPQIPISRKARKVTPLAHIDRQDDLAALDTYFTL